MKMMMTAGSCSVTITQYPMIETKIGIVSIKCCSSFKKVMQIMEVVGWGREEVIIGHR